MKIFSREYWSDIWVEITEVKWWILHRFHPKHRYHVHKFHKLKPGWHDVDHKMLHACFDFLVEFVEEECDGLENLKTQCDYAVDDEEFYNKVKNNYNIIKELYEWWKSLDEEQLLDLEFNVDKNTTDIVQEKFHKLIDIRRSLWT